MKGRTTEATSHLPRREGTARPPRRVDEPRQPRRLELDPDEERAPEEAGYGYGV